MFKGKRHSEESKKRISRSLQGRTPHNKGKSPSAEVREKIRLGVKRAWEDGGVREKVRLGVKRAWEDGRLSKPPPRVKELPPELYGIWLANNRSAAKRAWAEGRRKSVMTEVVRAKLARSVHNAWLRGELRGYSHKEETKRLLSVRTRQAHVEGRLGCDPELEKERLAKSYKSQHWRPNKPEKILQNMLDQHFPGEWKYTGDGTHTVGTFPADFTHVNDGKKAIIELFGDYWHNRPNMKWHQTELGRIMKYNFLGFRCLVIWEHELRDENAVAAKVRKFIRKKSAQA